MDVFQLSARFFGLFGSVVAISGTFYSASVFIENNLRNQACQDFAGYLQSGRLLSALIELPKGMREIFDQIFGRNHFSWKCIIRSAIFSLVAITAIWLAVAAQNRDFWEYTRQIIVPDAQNLESARLVDLVLLLWLAWAVPIDYVSLLKARIIIRWLDNSKFRHPSLLLGVVVLDVLAGSLLFYLGIAFISATLAIIATPAGTTFSVGFQNFWDIFDVSGLWTLLTWGAQDKTDSMFFYASMVPSIWIWMWVFATYITRLALRTSSLMRLLNYLLPIDTHPVRSVGLVSAVVSSVAYLSAHAIASLAG